MKLSNIETLTKVNKFTLFMIALSTSVIANAHGIHTNGTHASGFMSGVTHPMFGLDHLFAMISVGALSVKIGGRAVWALPLSFVSVMLLGGVMGMMSLPFFALEAGIALSVLVLGIALALDKKMPMLWSMLCVGFFALFHGYAHGAEMPSLAQPALYAIGFLLATVLLHVIGIGVAEISKHSQHGNRLLKYTGVGVAGFGFAILFGLS